MCAYVQKKIALNSFYSTGMCSESPNYDKFFKFELYRDATGSSDRCGVTCKREVSRGLRTVEWI